MVVSNMLQTVSSVAEMAVQKESRIFLVSAFNRLEWTGAVAKVLNCSCNKDLDDRMHLPGDEQMLRDRFLQTSLNIFAATKAWHEGKGEFS